MENKYGNHTCVLLSIPVENKSMMTLNHNHSRNNTATAQHDCRVEMEKKKI